MKPMIIGGSLAVLVLCVLGIYMVRVTRRRRMIFRFLDKDSDGTLSHAEIANVFAKVDKEQDGLITRDEWSSYLKSSGMAERKIEAAKALFDYLDRNLSGAIRPAEMMRAGGTLVQWWAWFRGALAPLGLTSKIRILYGRLPSAIHCVPMAAGALLLLVQLLVPVPDRFLRGRFQGACRL